MKLQDKQPSMQEQLELELDNKISNIDVKLDVLAVKNNQKTKLLKATNSIANNLSYAIAKTKKWAQQNDFSERSKDYFNLIFKMVMQFSNHLLDHESKINNSKK